MTTTEKRSDEAVSPLSPSLSFPSPSCSRTASDSHCCPHSSTAPAGFPTPQRSPHDSEVVLQGDYYQYISSEDEDDEEETDELHMSAARRNGRRKNGGCTSWMRSCRRLFRNKDSRRNGDITCHDDLQERRKRNIRLMMTYTVISTLFFSICQWNVFDAYLSFLAKDKGFQYNNSWVGLAESISGLVSLCLAIPVGVLVDRYSRVKLCRLAAILGTVAAVVSFYSFAYDNLTTLMINLFLWGVFAEISGSATQAIFADSLPQGQRSGAMTTNGMVATAGLSLGPGILVILFWSTGNNWSLTELHIPLLAGCLVAPVACAMLWHFVDPMAGASPPSSPHQRRRNSILLNASPALRKETILVDSSPMPFNHQEHTDYDDQQQTQDDTTGKSQTNDRTTPGELLLHEKCIPYLVAFSDLIRKVGAGMTVKFFPLFFIKDYGFRPVDMSMLFCVYPLCISLFMRFVQKLSKPMGRCQAVTLWQIMGITCLISMVYIRNVWVLVVVFLIRGSFQNAVYPIDRSIIMDYVPSRHRGKWNAVESLTSMTWSGSAIIGGVLADFHDYRYTFVITAMIYTVSLVAYLPLLWLVPRNETAVRKTLRLPKDDHDIYGKIEDAEDPLLVSSTAASTPTEFSEAPSPSDVHHLTVTDNADHKIFYPRPSRPQNQTRGEKKQL